MNSAKTRPKFLNFLKIRLPVTGVASILHRISGVILFIAIPFSIYLLHLSLSSASGFQEAKDCLASNWGIIFLIPLAWAFFHHLLAGFRFLFIDLDIGVSLPVARRTALIVIIAAVLITIYAGVMLL